MDERRLNGTEANTDEDTALVKTCQVELEGRGSQRLRSTTERTGKESSPRDRTIH